MGRHTVRYTYGDTPTGNTLRKGHLKYAKIINNNGRIAG